MLKAYEHGELSNANYVANHRTQRTNQSVCRLRVSRSAPEREGAGTGPGLVPAGLLWGPSMWAVDLESQAAAGPPQGCG